MELSATGQVMRINQTEYAEVMPVLKHVFLVGDLQKPAPHPFFRDQRVEMVVCSYEAGDNGRYHWHPEVTEYELVVEGQIGCFEVATGKTHWFAAGDLLVVPPGVCVLRIVNQQVRTVTLKVPSQDDKIHCNQCVRACTSRVEPYQG